MKELYESPFRNMNEEKPPLSAEIVVKKSRFKIANEAKIIELNPLEASQEWHVADLLSNGFDRWMFINEDDSYEYDNGGK
jgi:hypothetical protein